MYCRELTYAAYPICIHKRPLPHLEARQICGILNIETHIAYPDTRISPDQAASILNTSHQPKGYTRAHPKVAKGEFNERPEDRHGREAEGFVFMR